MFVDCVESVRPHFVGYNRGRKTRVKMSLEREKVPKKVKIVENVLTTHFFFFF